MSASHDRTELKNEVRAFWDAEACGERYMRGATLEEQLESHAKVKYALEPYIRDFARFADARRKRVLEIGVGMGVDHAEWAKSDPSYLAGIDLTPRAIELTSARLKMLGLTSDLRVSDAESLPFDDDSFDVVYSWGVLHHTPDTQAAIREVLRVLKPGGSARIMLYHKYGFVFQLLWIRYALLAGKPFRSMDDVIADQAESKGTKGFTLRSVAKLFDAFSSHKGRVCLSHGDLLEGDVGARHRGFALRAVKLVWPRRLVRAMPPVLGSYILVDATK